VISPTTSRASDAPGRRLRAAGLLLFAAIVSGCQTGIPADALKLSPVSLERRQQQTRKFEGASERDILSASAGVLQDLGFNIDESETKLGVIAASKMRTAFDSGQFMRHFFIGMLTGVHTPIDDRQKIRVCLVTRPAAGNDAKAYYVRVTFQRIVWNNQKQIARVEAVEIPEIYQEFFERLSKSIFLEAQNI
jgi:hypothetical protein